VKYTINGKEYSEFDINKRCAELMGVTVEVKGGTHKYLDKDQDDEYAPCTSWQAAGPIIEKCWDDLMCTDEWGDVNYPRWESLIIVHNCTKLVAACICLIETNQ